MRMPNISTFSTSGSKRTDKQIRETTDNCSKTDNYNIQFNKKYDCYERNDTAENYLANVPTDSYHISQTEYAFCYPRKYDGTRKQNRIIIKAVINNCNKPSSRVKNVQWYVEAMNCWLQTWRIAARQHILALCYAGAASNFYSRAFKN